MEGATFAKDRSPRFTWRVRGTQRRAEEEKAKSVSSSQKLSKKDVLSSRKIAGLRIYVELARNNENSRV
jgi:hypothetical protein